MICQLPSEIYSKFSKLSWYAFYSLTKFTMQSQYKCNTISINQIQIETFAVNLQKWLKIFLTELRNNFQKFKNGLIVTEIYSRNIMMLQYFSQLKDEISHK